MSIIDLIPRAISNNEEQLPGDSGTAVNGDFPLVMCKTTKHQWSVGGLHDRQIK